MKKYTVELLERHHVKTNFDSGEDSLNNYLHRQASQDIKRNLSAVYVLIEITENRNVLGFYSLSSSSILLDDLPDVVSKKLPRYPLIPVTLLGRLAIDKTVQRTGLGELLLVDALKKAASQTKVIGSMAVVVEAINDVSINFYKKFGFTEFSDRKNQLFLTMDTIKKI